MERANSSVLAGFRRKQGHAKKAWVLCFWSVWAVGCASKVVPGPDTTADLAEPPVEVWDFSSPQRDLAEPRDLSPPVDLGKPTGWPCATDAECASGVCRKIPPSGSGMCVGTCKTQADCDGLLGATSCQPERAGDKTGLCIPQSPNHCASCDKDKDCGNFSERCLTAPGDVAAACHLDCSLSASVCPTDYDCQEVSDGGTNRKLCVPKTKLCLDSLGGYCDRVALPQYCFRKNSAGQCLGQRTCLGGGRYDRCSAQVPQFKQCGDADPPGCVLALAADAIGTKKNCASCGNACGSDEDCCAKVCTKVTTVTDCGACGKSCAAGTGCCSGSCTPLDTVTNCGSCGNVCPGLGVSTSEVFCDGKATPVACGMSCRGDNYDVDTNLSNGCEVLDVTPPGHTQSTASPRGSKDCSDGTSRDTLSSGTPSDKREHKNPPVAGFSGLVGAAPDYWVVHADGGMFCVNDIAATFQTDGGSPTSCYRLTIITNKRTETLDTSGKGSVSMSTGSGAYSGGSDIYFVVQKTCSTPNPENVSYTVEYHL